MHLLHYNYSVISGSIVIVKVMSVCCPEVGAN